MNNATKKETGLVYICVDRDKLTGGFQISIDDDNGGYRIAGPKYCGMSERIKRHALNERDVAEIRAYLRRAMATISKTNRARAALAGPVEAQQ